MTQDPPSRLGPAQLDALGLALITMAQELWVVKDRQMIMEALIAERGLLPDLDAYQPGPELEAQLAQERKRFVSAITDVLMAGPAGPT